MPNSKALSCRKIGPARPCPSTATRSSSTRSSSICFSNGVESMPGRGNPASCHSLRRSQGSRLPRCVSDSGTASLRESWSGCSSRLSPTRTGEPVWGSAISHRIVEQHGGNLTAANSATAGAVFAVELPLSPECRLPNSSLDDRATKRPKCPGPVVDIAIPCPISRQL